MDWGISKPGFSPGLADGSSGPADGVCPADGNCPADGKGHAGDELAAGRLASGICPASGDPAACKAVSGEGLVPDGVAAVLGLGQPDGGTLAGQLVPGAGLLTVGVLPAGVFHPAGACTPAGMSPAWGLPSAGLLVHAGATFTGGWLPAGVFPAGVSVNSPLSRRRSSAVLFCTIPARASAYTSTSCAPHFSVRSRAACNACA